MERPRDGSGPDPSKPVSYDPEEDRFIAYDDAVEGRARIVPLDRLTREQMKKLVVERIRQEPPDYREGDFTQQFTRDELVEQVEQETEYGERKVKAEMRYLSQLLAQIEEGRKK